MIIFNDSARAAVEGDWVLARLFKVFQKFGPVKTSLVMFVAPILLCFMAGVVDGTLESTPRFVGVIQDYPLYILWIVVLLSVYLLHRLSFILKGFFEKDLPEILSKDSLSDQELEIFDRQFASILVPQRKFHFLEMSLILCFVGFWIIGFQASFDPYRYYGKDIWNSSFHPFGFVTLKFFNLIYMAILLAIFFYRFVGCLIGLSWLFSRISSKNGFVIRPLSPDNCAGLKILSNLSLQFMYMLLPFFLIFVSIILRGTTLLAYQEFGFLALILLLFVTFFLPLGSVHSAMKRAKGKELEAIAGHFADLNKNVKQRMSQRQYGGELVAEIEALEKLDYLYSRSERMPVWPFNVANVGRLLMASLIPVLVFIIQLIVNGDSIIYNIEKLHLFDKFIR